VRAMDEREKEFIIKELEYISKRLGYKLRVEELLAMKGELEMCYLMGKLWECERWTRLTIKGVEEHGK
jgi:hypothetical protein